MASLVHRFWSRLGTPLLAVAVLAATITGVGIAASSTESAEAQSTPVDICAAAPGGLSFVDTASGDVANGLLPIGVTDQPQLYTNVSGTGVDILFTPYTDSSRTTPRQIQPGSGLNTILTGGGADWHGVFEFFATGTTTPVEVTGFDLSVEDFEFSGSSNEFVENVTVVSGGTPQLLTMNSGGDITVTAAPTGSINIIGGTRLEAGFPVVSGGSDPGLWEWMVMPAISYSELSFDAGSNGNTDPHIGLCAPYAVKYPDRSDSPLAEATHFVSNYVKLGSLVDVDTGPIGNAAADGDGADDDGISSFPPLADTDTSYTLNVTARNRVGPGAVTAYAWIDFDRNGTFDADEFTSVAIPDGGTSTQTLNWTGLTDIVGGPSYVRVRVTDSPLTAADAATEGESGEVEDYLINIDGIIPPPPPIDTDGDGVPDGDDIDDDNDGIYDVNECPATLAYYFDGTTGDADEGWYAQGSNVEDEVSHSITGVNGSGISNVDAGITINTTGGSVLMQPASFVDVTRTYGVVDGIDLSAGQPSPGGGGQIGVYDETGGSLTAYSPDLGGIDLSDADQLTFDYWNWSGGGSDDTLIYTRSTETVTLRGGGTSASATIPLDTATLFNGEWVTLTFPLDTTTFGSNLPTVLASLTRIDINYESVDRDDIEDVDNNTWPSIEDAVNNTERMAIDTVLIDCDTDGDGIPDRLDLDSDNDGISDMVESGNATTLAKDANNDGTLDNTEMTNVVDGADEAANGAADFDGDLTPNFLDLDSDDDGIPDATEGRASGDYVAYAGTDTTADTDNDGILDIYDDSPTFGSTQTEFIAGDRPPNADADDTADTDPDYLDTDADGDGILDNAEGGSLVTGVAYTDPDGNVDDPFTGTLPNVDADTLDVDFRSLNVIPPPAGVCDVGYITYEEWWGVGGGDIIDLTSFAGYPDSPDTLEYATDLVFPVNIGASFGRRVRGYLIAPETGDYRFNIVSDDEGELYLSTDLNPANSTLIANLAGSTSQGNHNSSASQTSGTISLVAGEAYYIEVLHKEGGGGDHLEVFWETPSNSTAWTTVPGTQLAPLACDLVDFSDSAGYGDASHTIVADMRLGSWITDETSAVVDGDNTSDDGVPVPRLTPGDTADVTISADSIVASGSGNLYGWVDFNGNGTFEAAEFASTTVTAGTVDGDLVFSGYGTTMEDGYTYARFRYTTETLTSADFATAVSDGEVEDRTVEVGLQLIDTDGDGIPDGDDIDDDNDGIFDVNECPALLAYYFDGTTGDTDEGWYANGSSIEDEVSHSLTGVNGTGVSNIDPGYTVPRSGGGTLELFPASFPDVTQTHWIINGIDLTAGRLSPHGGGFIGDYDEIGGDTYLYSPPLNGIDLTGATQLSYDYWNWSTGGAGRTLSYSTSSSQVQLTGGGITLTETVPLDTSVLRNAEWVTQTFPLDAATWGPDIDTVLASLDLIRIRFESIQGDDGDNLQNSSYTSAEEAIHLMEAMAVDHIVIDCDTDGDGIPDRLDLDSDNDGISDMVESGNATTLAKDANNDGTLDNTEMTNVVDGADEAANGAADFDGDLTPNFLDLDSDDDGIPDATEGRASGDYVAYAGTDTTADTDNDGILDIYDDSPTFGSTQTTFIAGDRPPNADADDTADTDPDYLDTDADGDGILDINEGGSLVTGVAYTDPDGNVNDPFSGTLPDADNNNLGTDLDVDFRSIDGTPPISGSVTSDNDGDGIGDTPLDGVTVELQDPAGTVLATTLTDLSGAYSFTGFPAGDYVVVETDPTGYDSVSDTDGANDNTIAVTLTTAGSTGNNFVDALILVPAPACDPYTSFNQWDDGVPADDTLGPFTSTAANGDVLTITTSAPTSGSFDAGRPTYRETSATSSVTRLTTIRGGGTGAVTTYAFSALQSNLLMYVGDIQFSQEPVEIVGYNGATPVYPSFTQLGNGAFVSGPNLNIVNDADIDPQGFAFFTFLSPVDRVEIINSAGAVQDYILSRIIGCPSYDYSDAPTSYTSPWHRYTGAGDLFLGATIDAETQAQHAANGGTDGLGDDLDADGDDEDGIVVPTLLAGDTADVVIPAGDITATGTGTLYAWIDFNGDGSFQAGEFATTTVTAGVADSDLVFSGYGTTTLAGTTTYARFRLTTDVLTDDTGTAAIDERVRGFASDGEVEDYPITIEFVVSGTVFEDNTGDTTGDVAVVGVTVQLQDSLGNVIDTAVTDSTGYYEFLNVAPGDYQVVELNPLGYQSISDADGGTDDVILVTVVDTNVTDRFFVDRLNSAALVLVKSVTSVSDENTNGFTDTGDIITYEFEVTNTGNVTLDPVTISDAKLGLTDVACTGALLPGATATCTTPTPVTYTILDLDMDTGGVENQATATGTPPAGSGLTAVTADSDAGSTTDAQPVAIVDPGTTETDSPLNINGNDAGIPTDDPTTVLVEPVATIELIKSVTGVNDLNGNGFNDTGDVITYEFTVTNTGNVPLRDVVVNDAKIGLSAEPCATPLAPGDSCTVTATYAFTAADLLAGGVENTADAVGTPIDSTGADYTLIDGSVLANATDISDAGTTPEADPQPITDPELVLTDNPLAVNTPTADPTDDPTTVLAEPNAALELVKSITGVVDTTGDGLIGEGDTITYTFNVTNTGNVNLAPVAIDDATLSLVAEPCVASLAVGATAPCDLTYDYVLTQADVDAGGVENWATANGTPPAATGLADVTDTSDAGTTTATDPQTITNPESEETPNPLGLNIDNDLDPTDDPTTLLIDPVPSIELIKSIDGVVDTNGDGVIGVDDTVTYSFTVTNTGNVNLAPVTLDDAKLGISGATCVASLAPGATAPCGTAFDYVLTQADVDAGAVENRALATGAPVDSTGAPLTDLAGNPVPPATDDSDAGTDSDAGQTPVGDPSGTETLSPLGGITNTADPTDDPTTLLLPSVAQLELVKSASPVSDVNGNGLNDAGDEITYTFTVFNTGNVNLAPVTITDAKLGITGAACVDALAPGETATCSTTVTYTLIQADVDAGGVENTAEATAQPADTAGDPLIPLGGSTPLAPVTDTSDAGTTPDAAPAPIGDPSAEETPSPLNVNPNDAGDQGDDPTTVLAPPTAGIELVKSVTSIVDTTGDGVIGAGDTVNYSFSVSNTGIVTLTDVVISDAMLGLTDAACVATLLPGATATCSTTASHVLDQADVDAGGVENTATTTATPPAATGLAPVTDVSDAGTTADANADPITDPGTVETLSPIGVLPNSGTDPGEDPTTAVVTPLPSIELVKSAITLNDTDGNGFIGVGETIEYSMTVTNTGNVTLAPVTITDATLGLTDAACVASLAVGVTAPCDTTFTYTVTQADIDAGGVENTATAAGTPPASSGLAPVTDTSDTGTTAAADPQPVADPAGTETESPIGVLANDSGDPTDDPTTVLLSPLPEIQLMKTVTAIDDTTGDGVIGVGDTVNYSFSVTNTGNVNLAPVTVSDAKLGLTDAACVDSLAIGASATCTTTATYVLTQADVDAGAVENVATASATPADAAGNPLVDPVTDAPLADVTDTSDAGSTPDAPPAPIADPAAQETVNPLGEFTNDPADLTDDPTTALLLPVPQLELTKSVTAVTDVNGSGWNDAGDTITYSFSVTNTGNVNLAPVTIDDAKLGLTGAACVDSLAPGETATCTATATYEITQADVDAGGVENVATATGTPVDEAGDPLIPLGDTVPMAPVTDTSDAGSTADPMPTPITDPDAVETDSPVGPNPNDPADPTDDPTTLLIPAVPELELVKSITVVDDTNGDGLIGADDTVTYEFTVSNTGNVNLAPVTVTDATLGLTDAACVAALAPGGTATCSTVGTYVLTLADVDAGGVENTATGTGQPADSAGAPLVAPGGTTPLVPVTDTSDAGTTAEPDPQPIADPELVETDSPVGVLANDAGDPTEDPTTLVITPMPSIELVKSITLVDDTNASTVLDAGDTVSYEFSVTNTGNTTLAPVTVTDSFLGLTDAACAATLAPGETATCSTTGTYVLTVDDINAGGVENSATTTAQPADSAGAPLVPLGDTAPMAPITDVSDAGTTAAEDPQPIADPAGTETGSPLGTNPNDALDPTEDPTSLLVTPLPEIVLVKSITSIDDTTGDGIIGLGDTANYEFTVTNTGNVTLAPVTVSDALLGLVDAACVDSLAPGETAICSTAATHVFTQADVDAGGVENVATTTATPPAATGLAPITADSDAGSTPDPVPAPVADPAAEETTSPLGTNTNNPADPTDDPTSAMITPVPQLELVKSATAVTDVNGNGLNDAGDTITYEFTVTNTGNVNLAPVTIDDAKLGLVGAACVDNVAPLETATCSTTVTYTLTQGDVDAGGVENIALATGTPVTAAGDPLIPVGDTVPMAPVTDISDAGTTAEDQPQPIGDPGNTETTSPLAENPNDPADPGGDPTSVLAPPTAGIVLVKSATAVADTTGDGLIGAGDTITYEFTVMNTGIVTLAPVVVDDAMLGLVGAPCVDSLLPGVTATCSTVGTYVLTQADVDAGGFENTALAMATTPAASGLGDITDVSDAGTTPEADPQPITDPEQVETTSPIGGVANDPADPGDDPTAVLVTPLPSIELVKSVTLVDDTNGSGRVDAGDTVSYTFTVTNTGNVTLAPVTVSDALLGLVDAACVDLLAPGATATCSTVGTYVLTLADVNAGGVENTATTSAQPADSAGAPLVVPGDTAPLAPVSDVSDAGSTAADDPQPIADPAGTETDSPLGVIPNDPADPTEDPTTLTVTPLPEIALVKTVTSIDDTTGDGIIGPGDTVNYSFSVTNTGNVTLAPVTVSDPLLGLVDAACVDTIDPGATATCSTTDTHVLTQADVDAGGVENVAVAAATPPASTGLAPVTDTSDAGSTAESTPAPVADPAAEETTSPLGINPNDPADPGDDPTSAMITPVPQLELVKSVTAVVDTTGDGLIGAGDTVSYEFMVTNTGNVNLAPVTIDDAKLGLVGAACADNLAPLETATCSTTVDYVLTQADVDAGAVENTALATGTPVTAAGDPLIPVGDTVPMAPITDSSDAGTTAEADPQPIADPAGTETGSPLGANPNDAADPGDDPTTLVIVAQPSIVVVKSVTSIDDTNGSGRIDAGDTATYEFTVTNTGNVNLGPVTIDDATLGLIGAACVDNLAPGETLTCSTVGSYVFTQADVDAGGIENTALATGTPVTENGAPIIPVGDTVPVAPVTDVSDAGSTAEPTPAPIADPGATETDNPIGTFPNDPADPTEDPTTAAVTPLPELVLVKSVTSLTDTTADGLINAGDTVTYEFTVTNTGNVTLAPVTVSDTLLGLVDAACVDTLAPGETATCSTVGVYVLTQADIDADGVANSAIGTGLPPAVLGLDPATDTSDAGTEPEVGSTPITDPGATETIDPLGVLPNDPADPGDDPTTLVLGLGSFTGSVYDDANNDGVFDSTEAGVAGVEITLEGVDALGNTILLTTTTADDGSYTFSGLYTGVYTITETQPAGYFDGIDTAGSEGADMTTNDVQADIVLPVSTDATGYNFGELVPSSLSGTVTDDFGNPIEGVELTLTGADDLGNPVAVTATTDATGTYVFPDLRPGIYTITETQPVGYGDGGETAGTSGGDTITDDVIADIVLASGIDADGYDFDETTGSFAGVVYHDRDEDGTQGADDPGIGGVEITLTGTTDTGVDVTVVTYTDADGNYLFENLISGTYAITETQPDPYLDGDDTAGTAGGDTSVNDVISGIVLDPAVHATGYEFAELGNIITGTVWIDTDEDGILDPEEENRLEGVTIELFDTDGVLLETTTTDEFGIYAFPSYPAGDYTVVQIQPEDYGTTTPNTLDVSLPVGGIDGIDFGEDPGSIAGTIWEDVVWDGVDDGTEPRVPGVVISLLNTDGEVIASTTTDDNGDYRFDDLPAGTYTVRPELEADQVVTIPNSGPDDAVDSDFPYTVTVSVVDVTLVAGEDVTDLDLGIAVKDIDLAITIHTESTTVTVGDKVTYAVIGSNSGNAPVEDLDVTVTIPAGLTIDSVTSDYTCGTVPTGSGGALIDPITTDGCWTFTTNGQTVEAHWTGVVLPTQEVPVFTVSTTATSPGELTAEASIATADGAVEITYVNNQDDVPITAQAKPTAPTLAFTGAATDLLLALAVALLGSGGALLLHNRRRRKAVL